MLSFFKARRIVVGLTIMGLWLALVPLFGQSNATSKLTVGVTGARDATGTIVIALYQDADGFPENHSKVYRVRKAAINPQTLSAQAVFDDIPRGTYAAVVFHDENMNGVLDKNFVGVSKEGYGASNNPKKRMGPPTFEESKFSVDDAEHLIEIKLIY